MKVCANCQAQNLDEAATCSTCWNPLAAKQDARAVTTQPVITVPPSDLERLERAIDAMRRTVRRATVVILVGLVVQLVILGIAASGLIDQLTSARAVLDDVDTKVTAIYRALGGR